MGQRTLGTADEYRIITRIITRSHQLYLIGWLLARWRCMIPSHQLATTDSYGELAMVI